MKFYYVLYPRPTVIVGSGSLKNNEINFMTIAWVTPISEDPPTIGFSSYKENYSNTLIEKYQQFSVLIIDNIDLILKLGTTSGKEINKVKNYNLDVVSGKKLDVPLIKENLGFLECKLIDKINIGECIFYIGEVINWEIKDSKFLNRIPLHIGGKKFSFIKE